MGEKRKERAWQGVDVENSLRNRFEDVSRYADIIDRKHPVSEKYPPMSGADRAAQFSPFAALTGHDEAIRETVLRAQERIAHEIEKEE